MVTQFLHCRWRLLAPVLVLAASPVAAADIVSALTLQDALTRVDSHNPRLIALAYRGRAAAGLVEQAGFAPNPEVGVEVENVLGSGALSGVRSLEATVQARQRFERGGKRARRVDVAERERDAAVADVAIARVEILREAALAFIDVLGAQERVAMAAEALRLARETAGAVDSRLAAGAGSAAAAARARAAAAVAQASLSRAEAELAATRARLAAFWGGALDDVPSIAGSIRVPETLAAHESLVDRLAAHPRLRAQHASIAAREATLKLERAEAVSDITVGGGVRFEREGSDVGLVAGVSMPLPVRNRNQGNIRAAREHLAGAEEMLRAVEMELRADFTANWREMAAKHDAAVDMRRTVLPAALEAQAVVTRAHEAGELPLIDVLDAHRELLAVRSEVLELETAFVTAHARLEAMIDPMLPATAALLTPSQ